MIALIEENLEAIRGICRAHAVVRLDLFGSAAIGSFDPATSDLNFVVDLGPYVDGTAFRYLDLIADLQDLLGYEVHMITEPSLEDPLVRTMLEAQRRTLYEAEHA